MRAVARRPLGVRDELRASYSPMSNMTDAQLLAKVCGVTEDTARGMLASAGGLRALCAPGPDSPLSPAKQGRICASLELAQRHYQQEVQAGSVMDSPSATRRWLTSRFRDLPHEVFACLWLDNRHRLIAFDELFRGTIDGASVHPREVVRTALNRNAAAVILCHNHPSGVAEPSQADELITLRLKDALGLVDIRVLDHLIVGADKVVSLAERGVL